MTPMPQKVPFLDLQAQYRPIRDELLAAMTRVADSQRFILGPEVAALEEELAALLEVRHAVGVSSGTDALLVALMTVGIKPGDEVVVPAYSFFATVSTIVRLGARPIFVDIDPVTFNANPRLVDAAITPATRAILPVHLFGLSADMDSILASRNRSSDTIAVIEDAAQAIGATCKSRPVGGIGTIGCFSFYPTKNLGAFGEAGLLTTNDAALAARARRLRDHGMEPRYWHHEVGGNFRMDALQAAVLRVKARHLPAWTEARRANAAQYRRLFADAGLDGRIMLPDEPSGYRHIFNQFVIRTRNRDGLKRHLDDRGIGNEIYYPNPLHLQPCFGPLGHRRGDFPEAERAAEESLALPIYAELTLAQQRTVVASVAEWADAHVPSAERVG